MTTDRTALARQRGMKLADEMIYWIKSSDSALLEDSDGAPLAWQLLVLGAATRLADEEEGGNEGEGESERAALARQRGRQLAEDLVGWIRADEQRDLLAEGGAPLDADEIVRGATDYLAYQARRTRPPEPPPWATGD